MAAHQVGDGGSGAVKGHQVDLDAGGLGEGISSDMPHRTGAGGADLELAGVLFAPGDQVLDAVPLESALTVMAAG